MGKFWRQYRGECKVFQTYWGAYGGLRALLGSPYLHFSLFVAALAFPLWYEAPAFFDIIISAAPAVMAFSLSGVALLLAFGDDNYRKLLASAGGEIPSYVTLTASFVHFMVVQLSSFVLAVTLKGWVKPTPACVFHSS